MGLVGRAVAGGFIAEGEQLIRNGDVGDMGGDAQALRQLFRLAKPLGLRHRSCRDIAHRDIAALGDELARELAAHARAAPGDNGGPSGKILHWGSSDLSGSDCESLAGSERVLDSSPSTPFS